MQRMRKDAIIHRGRVFVPTRYGRNDGTDTKWIENLTEFRAAGGILCFNEDQTEITLRLPEGYKFSCRFENTP